MKKIFTAIIISLIMFIFKVEAQVSKVFRYGDTRDYEVVIRLLNGLECRDSRVIVELRHVSGKPRSDAFEVMFKLDGEHEYKMGWHDGGGGIFERFVCTRRSGMGTIRVFFGFNEVLFAEYRSEGENGYIRFFDAGGGRYGHPPSDRVPPPYRSDELCWEYRCIACDHWERTTRDAPERRQCPRGHTMAKMGPVRCR